MELQEKYTGLQNYNLERSYIPLFLNLAELLYLLLLILQKVMVVTIKKKAYNILIWLVGQFINLKPYSK